MTRWLILLLTLFPAAALAENPLGKGFSLTLPIDCKLGEDCFIQRYVNHAAVEGDRPIDYTCGSLTGDYHYGTDFRLLDKEQMRRGVNVLATAPGEVVEVRVPYEKSDPPFVRLLKSMTVENSCGTGVRLRHDFGWTSFYCHMRDGSVTVQIGDKVRQGQVLGKVGQTGAAEFPHVHFEVWKYGLPIDPFTGTTGPFNCKVDKRFPIWDKPLLPQLTYQPTFVLGGGFTDKEPTVQGARDGQYREARIPATAANIAFWAEIGGIRKGDQVLQEIIAPDGNVISHRKENYEVNAALILQSVVHKRIEYGPPLPPQASIKETAKALPPRLTNPEDLPDDALEPPTPEERIASRREKDESMVQTNPTTNLPVEGDYPPGEYIGRITLFRTENGQQEWPYLIREWNVRVY